MNLGSAARSRSSPATDKQPPTPLRVRGCFFCCDSHYIRPVCRRRRVMNPNYLIPAKPAPQRRVMNPNYLIPAKPAPRRRDMNSNYLTPSKPVPRRRVMNSNYLTPAKTTPRCRFMNPNCLTPAVDLISLFSSIYCACLYRVCSLSHRLYQFDSGGVKYGIMVSGSRMVCFAAATYCQPDSRTHRPSQWRSSRQ